MKLEELFEAARPQPAPRDEVIKVMKSMANQKVVWRGFKARLTAFAKIDNERSGFYGALSPIASTIMKKLNVKHPAFGTFQYSAAVQFGHPGIMVPIQPFRALQSETITDLLHARGAGPGAIDSYSERMDLQNSEIIFDIKEYYMVSINFAIKQLWDPEDFMGNKLHKQIQEVVEGIKTYQDVIDVLSKPMQ